jgi:hypothetical protein
MTTVFDKKSSPNEKDEEKSKKGRKRPLLSSRKCQ